MGRLTPIAALAVLAALAVAPSGRTAEQDARCFGDAATITGSGVIRGTPGNDVIIGSAARDTIYGGGGKDEICALDGDDRVDGGQGRDHLFGGAGSDRLEGNAGEDYIEAEAGNDRLLGGSGNDELSGNDGRDRLQGGTGDDRLTGDGAVGIVYGAGEFDFEVAADDLAGGPGIDEVLYGGPKGVSVTLDGRRNDGTRGEQDWVRADVEGAYVSRGTITGNAGPNRLSGRGDINGLGGPDQLIASGRGRFHGGPGNDQIRKADDVSEGAHLYGDAGNDTIDGTDWYYPACCRDTNAVRDWISCGTGRDHATLYFDSARSDCERVEGNRYGQGR